jgi:phosphatidylserine/phosphatidylglycerophosphate/cardiolipin synthase-like enzyme
MKARGPRIALVCLLAAWIGVAGWQAAKPLPQGVHVASPICRQSASEVAFIADITAADAFGRAAVSQGIFDTVLEVVRGAHRFIVLDYSGFGADAEAAGASARRHIAAELTDALLERRRTQPDLAVLFIADPANERYGAARSVELQLLRAAGVEVVLTDLDRLRDSNLAYSSLWRLTLRWWDPPSGPLGVETRRLNFKADGRRLIIADDGHGALTAVIGSAAPLDSESLWSNVAARLKGAALETLLESELAVARFSGWAGRSKPFLAPQAAQAPPPADCAAAAAPGSPAALAADDARVQLLTEGAIRAGLLARVDASARGDSIDVAMFHLAERGVVESLLAAARRGVSVRVMLDPDAAAPSGTAAGIPNQPVASELLARSGGAVRLRWYRTHGERFHDSLLMIYGPRQLWLTLGSAQLTRRSLSDYNLEANVAIEVARSSALAQQALQYFDTLWANRAALGIEYSADFAVFADPTQSDYWLGRLMEGAGLSAF